MTSYTLVEGPHDARTPEGNPLASYHHAGFSTDQGERFTRFLSDKGNAEILRRRGEGEVTFSLEELERWTVPPDMDALLARYDAEAGEGA